MPIKKDDHLSGYDASGKLQPHLRKSAPLPASSPTDGTGKPAASRQSGEKTKNNAKIALKGEQGVTSDAKSASPVDLAAGSVPSPSENDAAAAAPAVAASKAAMKKKSKSGITIRLNDDDKRRMDKLTEGGKSAAAVMLDAFRSSAQGTVPPVNHAMREDLMRLVKILDDLTEQLKAGPKAMRLYPILDAIKDKLFDLHADLITPRPPDATAQAIDQLSKQVAEIKNRALTINVSNQTDAQ